VTRIIKILHKRLNFLRRLRQSLRFDLQKFICIHPLYKCHFSCHLAHIFSPIFVFARIFFWTYTCRLEFINHDLKRTAVFLYFCIADFFCIANFFCISVLLIFSVLQIFLPIFSVLLYCAYTRKELPIFSALHIYPKRTALLSYCVECTTKKFTTNNKNNPIVCANEKYSCFSIYRKCMFNNRRFPLFHFSTFFSTNERV
jgi:hypothetical protein